MIHLNISFTMMLIYYHMHLSAAEDDVDLVKHIGQSFRFSAVEVFSNLHLLSFQAFPLMGAVILQMCLSLNSGYHEGKKGGEDKGYS